MNGTFKVYEANPSVEICIRPFVARFSFLPPDASLRQYMLFDRDGNRFNESAVAPLIEQFRETVAFAGLGKDDASPGGDTPNNGNDPEGPKKDVRVGSFVQWTSGGQERFPVPQKVVHIDEEGEFAFVEASPTGLPMSELAVVDPPEQLTPLQPRRAAPVNPFFKPPAPPEDDEPKAGTASDRTKLDEGTVRLDWPDELSPESVEEFQEWLIGRINRARRKAGLGKIKVEDV